MATTRAASSRQAKIRPGLRDLKDPKDNGARSLIMDREHSSRYQQEAHNRTSQEHPLGKGRTRKESQAGRFSDVPDKTGAKTRPRSPPRTPSLKRKRNDAIQDTVPTLARKKRSQALLASDTKGTNVEKDSIMEEIDPIEYWRREGCRLRKLFEIDDKTRAYLARDLDEERWLKDFFIPSMEQAKQGLDHMRSILARKRSSSSLQRKKSDAGSSADTSTPSDQRPREEKSAPYKHPGFPTVLATKGSFMDRDDEGIDMEGKRLCRRLLEDAQSTPQKSLFRDDIFETTCRRVRDRNEARVVQDVSQLIVPSAESLATFGTKDLESLIESVNEGWNNLIPLMKSRPQQDYAVGFGRSAFMEEQLARLAPFVVELTET